ncbi:hypothetical protein BO221_03260 [Archangium sp. Cb G35]|nr:hypothetical protein BO221_03260 [Archangium sp. Cb G35]
MRGANFSRDILTPGHIAEGSRPTDFSGAQLDGAILKATLDHVRFRGCSMVKADLTSADVRGADLSGANLTSASFQFSDARGAVLADADLTEAKFMSANLRDASFERAVLTRANLLQTRLHGANLRDAHIEETKFFGALYDKSTRWPVGFNPEAAGAHLDERKK